MGVWAAELTKTLLRRLGPWAVVILLLLNVRTIGPRIGTTIAYLSVGKVPPIHLNLIPKLAAPPHAGGGHEKGKGTHGKATHGKAKRPPARTTSTRPPAGLSFTDGAGCRPAGDYTSSKLDPRVRALLVAIIKQRHHITVSCIHTGHSYFVAGTHRVSNHTVWRAVDIATVDGRPVNRSNGAAHDLAVWIGQGHAGVQPSEVGSPWAFGKRPWFTDSGHQNHIHVGFSSWAGGT